MKRATAIWASLGAALMYFFDPQQGNRRRKMTADRTAGFFRRGLKKGERAGRAVTAEAYGVTQKVKHLREEEKDLDDVTLARKVETEIFRAADSPKGQVDVNAVDGVVYLRGEVETPDMIAELEQATRKVSGVKGVENLLHTPGTPAPTTTQESGSPS
jgi:osmotically-inducible protein OsmY